MGLEGGGVGLGLPIPLIEMVEKIFFFHLAYFSS